MTTAVEAPATTSAQRHETKIMLEGKVIAGKDSSNGL